jgi:hypothetical protein
MEPITGDEKRLATPEQEQKDAQKENFEASVMPAETSGDTTNVEPTAAETQSKPEDVATAETSAEPVEVTASTTVDTNNTQE